MADPLPTFHFIGGKGGVGKTTCSAALGIHAAARGKCVLVASTDPAPSLGDAFEARLSARPRRVLRDGLFAVEIGPAGGFRRWLDARRPLLESIALQGTWLDSEDVEKLLTLSLPGLDELAAMFEITQLARSSRFDHVVVDTAPTGHTLRMLALPETLDVVTAVFDAMRNKGRTVEQALRGHAAERAEDILIRDLAGVAAAMRTLLRNAQRTSVSWVTLPEPAAVAETNDAFGALERLGIAVQRCIVNRTTASPPDPCERCQARIAFERRAIADLNDVGQVSRVESRTVEPRGLRALQAIGRELEQPFTPERRQRAVRPWKAEVSGEPFDAADCVAAHTRLVIVGGKGGVGKTTAAIGIALRTATRRADRSVLLVSTDPAHSVGDLLGAPLSDVPSQPVREVANLEARELDARQAMKRLRETYSSAISSLFDRVAPQFGVDYTEDRAVMLRLLDLAPPGLDEIAAVLEISEAVVGPERRWDLLVMDTAPTGHALRLLEMPALLHDWVHALMTILLKYRQITGLGEIGALLLDLSRRVGRLRELLTDATCTRFVVVTRAAALPRLESERLIGRLRRLGISTPYLLANAVGRGSCRRCGRERAAEGKELDRLQRAANARGLRATLLLAPAEVPAPAGSDGIGAWGGRWRVPSRSDA